MENFILGCFHFVRKENGDLEGRYTNNSINFILDENATFLNGDNNGFLGDYLSTWIESDGSEVQGNLRIDIIEGTNNEKFRLFWEGPNNTGDFIGEGYLVNQMLVGSYMLANV